MALVLKDRVRETTAVIGTNDATLLGAVTGFQAFSAVGSGNTCYYTISDQAGSNWEVGIGTYNSVGPTLTRDTILASSNSDSKVNFPSGTKDVFLTYPSEKAVYLDAAGNLDIEGAVVINANTSSDALRITQSGSGNALLVEDSANPDATPFVVDASGNVVIGATASQFNFPLEAYTTSGLGFIIKQSSPDNGNNAFYFRKSRGTTPTSMNIVQNGDNLGGILFQGTDGVSAANAAGIQAFVDGVPGVGDMPGRLVFSTTADGASVPTERMRIGSAGSVGIGGYAAQINLYNAKRITGGTFSYGFSATNQVQSDVTNTAAGYHTSLSTQATTFTLSNLNHFWANQVPFGAGSAVTNQYGFRAESSLLGATNNYGFFSNLASSTGVWNFYAAGTAPSYFAGIVGVGVSPTGATSSKLFVGGDVTLTNTNTVLFSNLYYASGFKYVGNGYGAYIKLAGSSATAFEFGIAGSNSSGAGAAATAVIALNIDQSGNVLIPGPGGLGYGTGSGGAVTQTTSRTTGVTLNKTNGAITLVSAAGSATYQSFTVTNSTVAATDTIIVNQKSGTDLYEVFVTAVAAGSFRITFATTGGTTTEQPVFNFAVIKAVAA